MEVYSTRIQRLSDHLINQIAAGEVVERPASVVKELVENSLDAEATRVEILLKNGGIEEIVILDDGVGMSEPDLRLCIERHTTSKIREAGDLESILTFGFRGEALSSIASVSEVEIRTRTRDRQNALALGVSYGVVQEEIRPVGAPVGTCLTVRGLFERVPARKKFLRSLATEFSHCARVVREIALGNPHVSFHLKHQGASVKQYLAGDREQRFRECFFVDWEPLVIREEAPDAALEARLSPADHIQDRGEMFVYVNGRGVRNRNFLSAARAAYLDTLGPHHEPSGVLYLDLRPDWVDVNVHPQKLEVRCMRQETLYPWIVTSVRKAVSLHAPTSELVKEPELNYEPSPKLKFLGQLKAGQWLYENDEGLILVDPQALREIAPIRSRALAVPKVVRLASELRALVEQVAPLGFDIEPFGDGDIAVKAHPEGVSEPRIEEALVEALHAFHADPSTAVSRARAAIARLSEAPALSSGEVAALIENLDDPHGRSVLFRLSYDVIKKHFERT